MKLSNTDLINKFKARLGDTPSDEDVSFLEDLNDSLADDRSEEINALNASISELQARYDDLKGKYINRFGEASSPVSSGSTVDTVDNNETVEEETNEPLTVEEIAEMFG